MSGGAAFGYGQTKSQSHPQLTPQQYIDLYSKALPGILNLATSQESPALSNIAGGLNNANSILSQGTINQAGRYIPGLQQVGNQASSEQAGATGDLITGAGGNAARSAASLNNELNPVQTATNNKSLDLLNSINLNGLTGGEQAAVERGQNQYGVATGATGNMNSTDAVANAMQFGNALQEKQQRLGGIIGQTNAVGAQNSAVLNPAQFAVGSGNTAGNFGLGLFNPNAAAPFATAPLNFGSTFGSQVGAVGTASKSGSSGFNINGSGQGGSGCFLTTACCDWKGLPDNCEELSILRSFRDKYVPKVTIKEYYALAPSIVTKLTSEQLSYIWNRVKYCVSLIHSRKNEKAFLVYMNMFNTLKREVL